MLCVLPGNESRLVSEWLWLHSYAQMVRSADALFSRRHPPLFLWEGLEPVSTLSYALPFTYNCYQSPFNLYAGER